MLDLNRAAYMLSRLPIRDRLTRRLVPFNLRYSQRTITEAMLRQQARRRPIRVIILKARRVGGSSLTEGYGLLHGIAEEAALGLIVAHLFKSSKGLFEVPTNLIDCALPGRLPLADLLGITHTKQEITIPKHGGSSHISLATAGSVAGAGGRALSFTFLHLSEAAYFPGIQPFTSLLPTVPYDPSTFIVIESTANGRVGPGAAFYDYWQNAVSGNNDYEPIFLPWHKDPTYIRPEEDAADAPIDDYEEWLMREFHCTKGQIAWWRATLEAECKGTLAIMQQEYPASPEEAFTATGDPAFERDELEYTRSVVREPELVGDFKCSPGTYTNPFFEQYGAGDWAIYCMPVPGHKYFCGGDAARGMQIAEGDFEPSPEGDFASGVMWDGTTGELAAVMAKRVNPERLADMLNAAGRFYNNAMVNIELTGNLGVWAQKVIRDDLHYPNLYKWRGGRDDRVNDMNKYFKRNVLGWETTQRSREMMMDAFRAALRSTRCRPYSRALLGQMEVATRKEGFRWEIVRGHDDILMAAMIGWIAREQWGPPINTNASALAKVGSTLPPPEANLPGIRTVDDSALTLSKHYHKVMQYNRQKAAGVNNPLEGI